MLFRLLGAGLLIAVPLTAFAQEASLTRRDGFLQLWQSVLRPAYETREAPYQDVLAGDPGFLEITYAKRRGLLGDVTNFYPDEPLKLGDAMLWLFRTRNVADPDQMEPEHLPGLLERYPMIAPGADLEGTVTAAELTRLTQLFDERRRTEETKVSQYGEEFRGEGTAFGEIFNPDDFTAAHVTFPHDTLVRVTHVEDGRTVLVRVNDRGPFVPGRTMDLSSAAFGALAEGSRGVLTARLERLGDINLVDPALKAAWETQRAAFVATQSSPPPATVSDAVDEPVMCDAFGARYQQRITRDVRLMRGIPHTLKLGETLTLQSSGYFVLRSITQAGAVTRVEQWISPGERYQFTPAGTGTVELRIGATQGRERAFGMRVIDC